MRLTAIATALALLIASPAFADDALNKAVAAINTGKYAEAVQPLKQMAESGNPIAQLNLGLLYYYGRGVQENEKVAVEWLNKSASQGNVDAMFQLANAYTFGNETPKLVADADQEAARWYFRAANAGNADAQYSLGLLFIVGKGVQQNSQQAQYWMQQAAKNGHKDAQNYLSSPKK